jgi:hypothetical protein
MLAVAAIDESTRSLSLPVLYQCCVFRFRSWMLDAGKRFYTQHPATSSKEERCESLRAYSVVSGS